MRRALNNNGILLALFLALAVEAGCAVIAGRDDAAPSLFPQDFRINFVETLRNEASLLGEGLKELPTSTDVAAMTLQRPNGVYADDFRVYVTDTAPPRLFIFDRGERRVTILDAARLRSPDARPDEKMLLSPAGIAVDATGVILVSDAQQGRVFGYDRNGKLLLAIGRTVILSLPSGLAIDNMRNRLYVADSHAQKVKAFDNLGNFLFDIGGAGQPDADFKFPISAALDMGGNLYVLDSMRKRVHAYDPDGKFIRAFSLTTDIPGGAIRPKGIAVDRDGHIYVTDSVNNNILIYNPDGALAMTWGKTGRLAGDFLMPTGIFIDRQNRIYIADQANSRIQTFQYMK